MANGRSSFTAPGQRETIVRGERTDPRSILGQAFVWGACGSFVVLVVMVFIFWNKGVRWYWIWDNLRWLAIFPVAPFVIAAVLAVYALTVEIFDPNWPPPRKAMSSTRPVWPHSQEREQPKVDRRVKVADFMAELSEDD